MLMTVSTDRRHESKKNNPIMHPTYGGVTVTQKSRVQVRAISLSGNNLRQLVHTHNAFVTDQYNLVPVKGR